MHVVCSNKHKPDEDIINCKCTKQTTEILLGQGFQNEVIKNRDAIEW